VARGKFTTAFLLQCLAATGVQWGAFVFAVVGAALGVISSFVSHQLSEITQADAHRRIAEARATADAANVEVARANAAAAKANERAARHCWRSAGSRYR
jgi:hypothetical protein